MLNPKHQTLPNGIAAEYVDPCPTCQAPATEEGTGDCPDCGGTMLVSDPSDPTGHTPTHCRCFTIAPPVSSLYTAVEKLAREWDKESRQARDSAKATESIADFAEGQSATFNDCAADLRTILKEHREAEPQITEAMKERATMALMPWKPWKEAQAMAEAVLSAAFNSRGGNITLDLDEGGSENDREGGE